MTARRLVAAAVVALAGPAVAQEPASEAESWNLYAEVPTRFEATVTDPLCALTGDCPADCGGGTRQLVLLRVTDDAMILPVKNHQPLFTGAATELQPFCGKRVEVDGLMLVDADTGLDNIYQVQKIREVGATDWVAARGWTEAWARANPDLPPSGDPWFRRDPRVNAEIAAFGWFGLGPERDAAILSELYP
jgi:hypothetical protein